MTKIIWTVTGYVLDDDPVELAKDCFCAAFAVVSFWQLRGTGYIQFWQDLLRYPLRLTQSQLPLLSMAKLEPARPSSD